MAGVGVQEDVLEGIGRGRRATFEGETVAKIELVEPVQRLRFVEEPPDKAVREEAFLIYLVAEGDAPIPGGVKSVSTTAILDGI